MKIFSINEKLLLDDKFENGGQKEACMAGSTLICRLSSTGQDKHGVSAADYSIRDTFSASGTPGWLNDFEYISHETKARSDE